MVEMTPKPLILRLPWLVMHIHVWIENKVTVIVKKKDFLPLQSLFSFNCIGTTDEPAWHISLFKIMS